MTGPIAFALAEAVHRRLANAVSANGCNGDRAIHPKSQKLVDRHHTAVRKHWNKVRLHGCSSKNLILQFSSMHSVGTEAVDVGFFGWNDRSFIAVHAHSCVARLASDSIGVRAASTRSATALVSRIRMLESTSRGPWHSSQYPLSPSARYDE